MNIINWVKLFKNTMRSDIHHYNEGKRSLNLIRARKSIIPNLKKPLFIVGSPRSGTTILGSCLAQLTNISYHHEPIFTKKLSGYVYKRNISFFKQAYYIILYTDGYKEFILMVILYFQKRHLVIVLLFLFE